MVETYTPQGGYSPQNIQLQNLQQTQANLSPMPQSSAPYPEPTANQTAAAYPQFVQQQAAALAPQAQFQQGAQASGDLQKQYALFQHDMSLANGQSPVGTQAVPGAPAPATYDPNTMANTMTPQAVAGANPIQQGMQLGQSNPYYGMMFQSGALDSAAQAQSSMLQKAQQYNLGQFQSQLGASKDIYQMAYQNQLANQQQAETQKNDLISNLSTLASLGVVSPDQISQMLGLPSAGAQSSYDQQIAAAQASGDQPAEIKAYLSKLSQYPVGSPMYTKILADYKNAHGTDLLQVTKTAQVQDQEGQQILQSVAALKKAVAAKGAGILGTSLIPQLGGLTGGRESDPNTKYLYTQLNNLVQDYYKTKAKTPIALPDLSADNSTINGVLDQITSDVNSDQALSGGSAALQGGAAAPGTAPTPGSASDPLGIL